MDGFLGSEICFRISCSIAKYFWKMEAIVLYFFFRGGGGVTKVHYGVCETGEWPFV